MCSDYRLLERVPVEEYFAGFGAALAYPEGIPNFEPRDDIRKRIEEATKYVALDQLCLSPQCGFASTEEGNILAEEEQWAKLRTIVEIAEEVWG